MASSLSFSFTTASPEHGFFFPNPSPKFPLKLHSTKMSSLGLIRSQSATADHTAMTTSSPSSSPSPSSPSPSPSSSSPSSSNQVFSKSLSESKAVSEQVQEASDSTQKAFSVKDEIWNQYKGSQQLSKWARSRKIRLGRTPNNMLSPSPSPSLTPSIPSLSPSSSSASLPSQSSVSSLLETPSSSSSSSLSPSPSTTSPLLSSSPPDHDVHMLNMDMKLAHNNDDDKNDSSSHERPENVIYMVSDGTGWTAEHCVNAALGQFEHCLVDRGCPVNTHLFSQVVDVERLLEIIRDAGKENATLIYTLADPVLAETAKNACELYGIPHLDLLGPITELLGGHMGVAPLGLPRGAPGRTMALSREYFQRIAAVEFTIKQDDGALPQNLHKADLVLVGVSRTSKTPLSTYLAQKGYKVANVPLVLGIEPPKELFEVDQNKIYALTINPNFLHSIRTARSKTLGLSGSIVYSEMEHIKKELEYSNKLFVENAKWPVIEVTGKAIEETAAVILRIYHDREGKHVMPRISHRY